MRFTAFFALVVASLLALTKIALADPNGGAGFSTAKNNGQTATASAETGGGSGQVQVPKAAPASGGSGPALACEYEAIIPGFAFLFPVGSPTVGKEYRLVCHESGAITPVVDQIVTYNPAVPPQVLVDTARQRAEAELDPPAPTVGVNPPHGTQLVGVPTWFWIDDPWLPVSATATVGPVSATVTATPRDVRWDLGDDTSITCAGPGTPYDTGRPPEAQHSDCTHTYTNRSTTRGPNAGYRITATVTFDVTWTATTGQGGNLGTITRATTIDLVVREAQAVIR